MPLASWFTRKSKSKSTNARSLGEKAALAAEFGARSAHGRLGHSRVANLQFGVATSGTNSPSNEVAKNIKKRKEEYVAKYSKALQAKAEEMSTPSRLEAVDKLAAELHAEIESGKEEVTLTMKKSEAKVVGFALAIGIVLLKAVALTVANVAGIFIFFIAFIFDVFNMSTSSDAVLRGLLQMNGLASAAPNNKSRPSSKLAIRNPAGAE
jgi:hypothetical protein